MPKLTATLGAKKGVLATRKQVRIHLTRWKPDNPKEKAMMAFFIFGLSIALMFLKAVVLVDLWLWFVVPLGAPVVGMAQAYGLGLIVSWLSVVTEYSNKTHAELMYGLGHSLARALMVWLVGWILS
jgi:hypothetical protein